MASNESKEKVLFKVVDVTVDATSIKVFGFSEDIEDGGELHIYTKKYDNTSKQFVEDAATTAAANEATQAVFGVDAEDINKDNALDFLDTEFEGYLSDNGSSIFLTPPAKFVSYDKINGAAAKVLKGLGGPIDSTPVTETRRHAVSKAGQPYAICRFELGVVADVRGEQKTYRVSQLAFNNPDDPDEGDIIVSLNYLDKTAKDKYADLDMGRITDPSRAKAIELVADKMVDSRRRRIIEDFSKASGGDSLEQIVGEGGTITFDYLEVAKSGVGEYLIGHVADTDLF